MPLVFHIPLDLKIWCVEDRAISGDLPDKLELLNNQLLDSEVNIREIAIIAIEKCAKQKYVHDDLEFHHIAIYPIINDGILMGLKPMFIDFGQMKKVESVEEAREIMMEKLDYLFEEYEDYQFF